MKKIKIFLPKLSKTKIIIGIILVVILFSFIISSQSKKKETFEIYTTRLSDISERIIISGNVDTSNSALVYSQSTGIVEEVLAKNGDTVDAGQEIIKIKSTVSEIERSSAFATYLSSVTSLNTVKQAKESNQSLLEAGRKSVIDSSIAIQELENRRNSGINNPGTGKPYTQDEIESIKSSFTSSKQSFTASEKRYLDSNSAINAAQSVTSAAWLTYQATVDGVVKAPISGTISNLAVASGNSVIAKPTTPLSTTNVSPVFQIATSESISIIIKLNELDILKVKPNQDAQVVFDALPNETFKAYVSRLDEVGKNENAVVAYNAYISLNKLDNRIRPAMTSTITITTNSKKSALVVPNAALFKKTNKVQVKVKNGKSEISKDVIVGIKNEKESEIVSGLSAGETILIQK